MLLLDTGISRWLGVRVVDRGVYVRCMMCFFFVVVCFFFVLFWLLLFVFVVFFFFQAKDGIRDSP